MIKISIERRLLLKPEGAPEDWVCPRSDMADVYVDFKYPTRRDVSLRWEFLNGRNREFPFNLITLEEYELWLSYAGTNLSILVSRRDDDGNLLWNEDKSAILANRINFSRQMRPSEFLQSLKSLPLSLKQAWYSRMTEVVNWKEDHG